MFALPDLDYPYEALEPYIDETTMKIHHDKHHGTYVQNLNDALAGKEEFLNMEVEDLIKDLDKVSEDIRAKVRNNGGGHANHSFFWKIMSRPKENEESSLARGPLVEAIDSTFGNFASFKEKFKAAGLGRFGSGWVWLIADRGSLDILDTPNQDTPLMEGKVPILGLDVWEHAYYLKYQNKRADYIDAWWNVVAWDEANRLFESAS